MRSARMRGRSGVGGRVPPGMQPTLPSAHDSWPGRRVSRGRVRDGQGRAVKHLYLLRHAKSDWDTPFPDHDRPLSTRGHRAGDLVAAYLRAEGIRPELILCSSSERTRATLAHLLPALGDGTTILVERDLYGAEASTLLARVRRIDDAVVSTMVIAHNPGTEDLALSLAGAGDAAARARMKSKYPTAGLAGFDVDGAWRDLASGGARLTAFVVPRDLEGKADEVGP
jgi:phosphohistidine phosphatase